MAANPSAEPWNAAQVAKPLARSIIGSNHEPQKSRNVDWRRKHAACCERVEWRLDRNKHACQGDAYDYHEYDGRYRMVRHPRVAILDVAEPCDRQIRLKQNAEYKNTEPPKEDSRQHLGREPVLSGVAGEQHSARAGDYEPDGKHAKAIEHCKEPKIDQRGDPLLGYSACREPMTEMT